MTTQDQTGIAERLAAYEELRRSFKMEVPETFNYARDVVDDWATREPERTALVTVAAEGDLVHRWSFDEISTGSDRVASVLAGRGVKRGDRVLVILPRIAEWHLVLLACFKLGAVAVPGTTQLTARDIAYRIEHAEAEAVVTDLEGTSKVDEPGVGVGLKLCVDGAPDGWVSLPEELESVGDSGYPGAETSADDPLLVYFTSGTTGHPKMVLHSHASLGIGHHVTARFWMDLSPDDLHWTLSDTGWAKAAWGMMFGQWRIGAAVFMWDGRGKPDPELILSLIGRHQVTTFCAPPTLYRAFVQLDLDAFDWSSLRHALAAGEPLDAETMSVWRRATGIEIHDGYGQTETANLVANIPGQTIKPGSMGLPVPGFDVHVVDDEGRQLPPGEEGHLAVSVEPTRPVGLFTGYWGDQERTEAVFRNGYYYTGDRAVRDEDGYLWFVSRDDDLIISAGYRIGPFEVESALIEHPAVVEAAVVGAPHPQRGQVVRAYVVLASGFLPSPDLAAEIQTHVKTVTAPYKHPREVEFVEQLPKTVSGKIRRVELRERARGSVRAPDADEAAGG